MNKIKAPRENRSHYPNDLAEETMVSSLQDDNKRGKSGKLVCFRPNKDLQFLI